MIQFLSKEYYIIYVYMENESILTTILSMTKEELRSFILQCISEANIRERFMLYILLKS